MECSRQRANSTIMVILPVGAVVTGPTVTVNAFQLIKCPHNKNIYTAGTPDIEELRKLRISDGYTPLNQSYFETVLAVFHG